METAEPVQALQVPVLIAGGGPVGMTLALNLARYGIRSIVAERNATTTRHPKMDLTNGRSMELFRRLGLVDRLRDAGVPRDNAFDIAWFTSVSGEELHRFHYPSANEQTSLIRTENDGHHASEAGLRVSQIEIEPVLKRAIDENPLIDVRFGTRFDRLVGQDPDGVTVDLVEEATGAATRVRCSYLAACDGGGSRVRRQIGIELDGQMAVAGAYMVHFRSTDPVLKKWGPTWHYQNGAGTIIAQNDDDIFTLQAWLIPGLGLEEKTPQEVLEGWVGRPFDYEILQANPWTANFVVAQRYREGRVVLAGDSAHQFIPTGGYGMNSGIADAAGLSWVLAALLEGWGGEGLLDAYEQERRATAWWHLRAAERHMGVRGEIGQYYAEAGELERETPDHAANRAALADRIARIGNAENESWGVELGYRYDGSPVVVGDGEDATAVDPLTYRPDTTPGARLPHVFLDDGVALHDRLGRYFTLVVIDDGDASALTEAAAEAGVPVELLVLKRPDLLPIYRRNMLLVRPDQHVAWRGDALPGDARALIEQVTGNMTGAASAKAAA